MHQPATLPCGHSFCRKCLRQCLVHDLRCPSCRVDVPYNATDPAVNIALTEALQLLHPREAAERRAEEQDAPPAPDEGGLPSFPLFVLEPLLPHQVMHLHVFEPRYIRLVQRCLTEPALDRCFGMVPFRGAM